MSPKSLILLLVVGLCAAQAAAAVHRPGLHGEHALARLRHERGIYELMGAAKTKLEGILDMARDAAAVSVETVKNYLFDLEAQVLNAGTAQLNARGINVNLTTIAGLMKSNVKTCVTDEKIVAAGKVIVTDLAQCVSQDAKSLEALIENMKDLWATAQKMPETMEEVAQQCSEHVDHDIEGDALEEDAEAHDLAEKANQLLEEASKTMSKRALWSFARTTRCVKAVYNLSKGDMVTIPGKIVAAAANGYRVYQAAQGGIQSCVGARATKNMPAIASLSLELGTCLAQVDIDKLIAEYPALENVRQLMDLANKVQAIQKDPKGALTAMAGSAMSGSLPGMPGVALPAAARQALAAKGGLL